MVQLGHQILVVLSMGTARNNLAGAGIQTAALGFWWLCTSRCYKANRRI
jgi:hypothetical protein